MKKIYESRKIDKKEIKKVIKIITNKTTPLYVYYSGVGTKVFYLTTKELKKMVNKKIPKIVIYENLDVEFCGYHFFSISNSEIEKIAKAFGISKETLENKIQNNETCIFF